MAAYEAALDRHSRRHEDGRAEKHYLRYLDSPGYHLRDVERLAAGIGPLDDNEFDQRARRTDSRPGGGPYGAAPQPLRTGCPCCSTTVGFLTQHETVWPRPLGAVGVIAWAVRWVASVCGRGGDWASPHRPGRDQLHLTPGPGWGTASPRPTCKRAAGPAIHNGGL